MHHNENKKREQGIVRKVICAVGVIVLMFGLFVTIGMMIGFAVVCDITSNVFWKVGIIELIGLVVCYIGSGDWI